MRCGEKEEVSEMWEGCMYLVELFMQEPLSNLIHVVGEKE